MYICVYVCAYVCMYVCACVRACVCVVKALDLSAISVFLCHCDDMMCNLD